MSKLKILVAIVIGLVVGVVLGLSLKQDVASVGGVNFEYESFTEGFKAFKVSEFLEGFTVGGNTVVDEDGALTSREAVLTPTADVTLTTAQTGTTVNLGTAGVDVTLPAVASSAGVHYKFVISAAYATTNITVVSAAGDDIEGSLIVAGAVVDCDASDVITSVADGENIGDFFEIFSNGTKWFIGQSGALTASKLTCTG